MFNLIDRKYPIKSRVSQRIKEHLEDQLKKKFPDKEAHLPEEQRQGYIPDAVVKAIRQAMRERPDENQGNIHHKNATPAEAPGNMNAVIETIRPSICLPIETVV